MINLPTKNRLKKGVVRRAKILQTTLSMPHKLLYVYGILSLKSLHLPDFLIIGTPKAGTTWLKKNLDCHPDLFLPETNLNNTTEVRYFNQKFNKSLQWYSDLFLPGKDKIKGEKTPSYCVLPKKRIQFIHSIMPKVKVIFLMRNPIERDWSHAVMNLIKFDKKHLEQIPKEKFIFHFNLNERFSNYLNIINNWRSFFPENQLFTGCFDDIHRHPKQLLIDIFNFLNVSSSINLSTFPYRKKINKNPKIQIPDFYKNYLKNKYALQIQKLATIYSNTISEWNNI